MYVDILVPSFVMSENLIEKLLKSPYIHKIKSVSVPSETQRMLTLEITDNLGPELLVALGMDIQIEINKCLI